jgi:hypothetical protein
VGQGSRGAGGQEGRGAGGQGGRGAGGQGGRGAGEQGSRGAGDVEDRADREQQTGEQGSRRTGCRRAGKYESRFEEGLRRRVLGGGWIEGGRSETLHRR